MAECSFGEREQEGVIGEILAFDWCGGGLAEKPTESTQLFIQFMNMHSSMSVCTVIYTLSLLSKILIKFLILQI